MPGRRALKDDFYYAVRKKLDERSECQYDLISLIGVGEKYISLLLTGKASTPQRAKYLPKIANHLGIDWLPEDVVEYLSQGSAGQNKTTFQSKISGVKETA